MTGIEQVLGAVASARHGGAQQKSDGEPSEESAFLAELTDLESSEGVDSDVIADARALVIKAQGVAIGSEDVPTPEPVIGLVSGDRPARAEVSTPAEALTAEARNPALPLLAKTQHPPDKSSDPSEFMLRRPLQNDDAEGLPEAQSRLQLTAEEQRKSDPLSVAQSVGKPAQSVEPKPLEASAIALDAKSAAPAETANEKLAAPLAMASVTGQRGELRSVQPEDKTLQKSLDAAAVQPSAAPPQPGKSASGAPPELLKPNTTDPAPNMDRKLRAGPQPEMTLGTQVTTAQSQLGTQTAVQQVPQPQLAQFALVSEPKPMGFVAEGELQSLSSLGPQGSTAQLQGTTAAQAFSSAPAAPQTQVSQAIALHIDKQRPGMEGGQIELRLEPEELGRLKITFTPREAGMLVSLVAERAETMELLRRNSEEFMRDLAGMGLGDAQLEFGSGQGSAQDREPSGEDGFVVSVPELDTALTSPARVLVADDRLDIRL